MVPGNFGNMKTKKITYGTDFCPQTAEIAYELYCCRRDGSKEFDVELLSGTWPSTNELARALDGGTTHGGAEVLETSGSKRVIRVLRER
jgi:hypothetical protein